MHCRYIFHAIHEISGVGWGGDGEGGQMEFSTNEMGSHLWKSYITRRMKKVTMADLIGVALISFIFFMYFI